MVDDNQRKIDDSFEQRLFKMENVIAELSQEVYELRNRKIMIWSDSTTTMDDALDETWRWLTPQLPEGFTIGEVKWTRSVRNLRILRVDLVYEWVHGLSEVHKQVMDAFLLVPRPYNEEVMVLDHRVADWKMTHPDFVLTYEDHSRYGKMSNVQRKEMKKGLNLKLKKE